MTMGKYSRDPRFACLFIGLCLVQTGCGSSTHQANSPPGSSSDVQVQHVFIVVEENHSYSSVIGNSDMPYLNRLATTYAYAQGYYADTHPSIGNYFMLTTGQIVTNDDGSSAEVTADNIVRHLVAAGKTWKEYSEDLPSVGYTGGDTGGYVQHHNPLSYFSDVRASSAEAQNLVPFAQLATDLANHSLPNYGFIVPNDDDNAHDGTLAQADAWLQANIDPLVKSSDFNSPGGGLLIIVFDESFDSDTVNGGGHVAWLVVGPNVKKGFTPAATYQHESTLRFMSEAIGLTDFPGAAASAPDMEEFISGD
jgi:phosphatidylinositol-3-phosphatase